ncbi:MAG: bacteriophage abortive infection AbiH family protein [Alteromonadaceae bacterium]|nr:bacteriophage abortive infection AbiH family protein [Alteromonadaceae bacterium]
MQNDILYILGNGFDIHHGIKSRYSDFKEYIKLIDCDVADSIEKYLMISENWNNLESALSSVDVDTLIDDAMQYLASYSDENWSDSGHHSFQIEVERYTDSLSSELKRHLLNWVLELRIPTQKKIKVISPSAFFLSFNYTDTLNKIYDVPCERILHIHGKAINKDSELVLGHDWSSSKTYTENANIQFDEDWDTRVMEGYGIVDDYFKKTFKPAQDLINDNELFFKKLNSIRHIYVLGHSISEVDIKYFANIVNNIDKQSVQWHLSYYDAEDEHSHLSALIYLGIKENLIHISHIDCFS